jgi:nitrite reductase/ring-hydroxylating ferredoxin subunit
MRLRPDRAKPARSCEHGSQWEIATGAGIKGPATEALATYEVQEVDGDIQVRA